MGVNLKSLIGKLNNPTRSALEGAAGLCLARTHYDIEIEHYLLKLMDATDTDVSRIFYRFGINQSRLSAELTRSLDKLKSGNARTPAISPSVLKMMTAGLDARLDRFRRGADPHRLHDPGAHPGRRTGAHPARGQQGVAEDRARGAQERFRLHRRRLARGRRHRGSRRGSGRGRAAARGREDPQSGSVHRRPHRERASKGKIDPVLGRDVEIRQIIDILMRRRQNNPILTGEAGVGKTAVVEGFALRIANGDVPPPLKNVTLRTLDLALLQAGAGIKGEFENRLKGLIEEVKSSPTPIILFIDEAHTMIGAGGQAGQNDAANLLKPALARGELRTIAATTWSEYKKYFEKDPALARRFQVVKVEEPDETESAW